MAPDADHLRPTSNIPVPDPSLLTTEQLRDAIGTLRTLLETQIVSLRHDLQVFQSGHEEKHSTVVASAIQHRKELTDANIATIQTQIDAQVVAGQERVRQLAEHVASSLAASDLRYQQRYDAQSDALKAAFEAQQNATSAALASAKEAVQTALVSSEKAVTKAEITTSKLIPRAEVESRFVDVIHQVELATAASDSRLNSITETVRGLIALSDRVEKVTEALAGLDRITDAKFVTFRTLIESQADKVALALAASNKAVDAAFASSAAAISKAEIFNEKRFDIITKQIDELKSYRDAMTGQGRGVTDLWGYIVGGLGAIATVVGLYFALSQK